MKALLNEGFDNKDDKLGSCFFIFRKTLAFLLIIISFSIVIDHYFSFDNIPLITHEQNSKPYSGQNHCVDLVDSQEYSFTEYGTLIIHNNFNVIEPNRSYEFRPLLHTHVIWQPPEFIS